MKSFEIRRVSDESDLARLRRFMLAQPQYYPEPGYGEWVDGKFLPRVDSGAAVAYLLLQDAQVCGDVGFHLLGPGTVEIKNLRIDPKYRNRFYGRTALRVVEVEGAILAGVEPGSLNIITDVTTSNFPGVEFFLRAGFNITDMQRLYSPVQDEYLLKKVA